MHGNILDRRREKNNISGTGEDVLDKDAKEVHKEDGIPLPALPSPLLHHRFQRSHYLNLERNGGHAAGGPLPAPLVGG